MTVIRHDQWGPQRLLEQRVLAPHGVLAEMPAVIAPQDHDRILGGAGFL